ncbi:MAG: hypothetical protein ABSH15_10795 [Verrucomicrobiota bacterium]|jgi:hypothetical protein
MKPSDKLTDSEYQLAQLSNMSTNTRKQCAAVRKYARQCEADGEKHAAEQEEDAEEQVGQ